MARTAHRPDPDCTHENPTTYSESAEGLMITHERAVQELRAHGLTDRTDFYADCGVHSTYGAAAVLRWLGY